MVEISIHAPREGSDGADLLQKGFLENFYPRSPRGERQYCPVCRPVVEAISIHAPREGSDAVCAFAGPSRTISIHAPREGSDLFEFFLANQCSEFLSTLPARGATFSSLPTIGGVDNFYPRSPRGERRPQDDA